jgi:hypothetical protein
MGTAHWAPSLAELGLADRRALIPRCFHSERIGILRFLCYPVAQSMSSLAPLRQTNVSRTAEHADGVCTTGVGVHWFLESMGVNG